MDAGIKTLQMEVERIQPVHTEHREEAGTHGTYVEPEQSL